MADYPDPVFPDQHTTATYTTTTQQTRSAQPVNCTIDKVYPVSLPGIFRIVEIILGFLYWTVVCSYSYSYYFDGYGFVIFTVVTAWVFTLILFMLHLFSVTKTVTFIHWVFTELINNAAWCLLHFIAAILISIAAGELKGSQNGKLVWGCICGWVLFVLYGLSAFLDFREFMAMGGMSTVCGGRAATTTTTTTTHTSTVITGGAGVETKEEKEAPPPYPGGGPFQ